MKKNNTVFVVLAAGNSTRMCSQTSKIFHDLGGRSIIHHVFSSIESISDNIITVISKDTKSLFENYKTVVQEQQLGTGNALQTALPHIDNTIDDIVVVCGDMPLISSKTLLDIANTTSDIAIGVFETTSNTSYGRVVLGEHQNLQKIVEYKDRQKEYTNIAYSGIMKIKKSLAQELLPQIGQNNNAKEFYLTEIIELAKHVKKEIIFGQENEFLGVNDRIDLSKARSLLNQRWIKKLMLEGVTFEHPDSVLISFDTKIGRDSFVGANVVIHTNVEIESDVTIHPFSYLSDCVIKSGAFIGPFTHVRGGSTTEERAQIGNFVEVKKSTFGKNSKAKHLSYIGDADIGCNVNFGAGSITCNYDGKNKHKMTIEDGVFIGSNTSLIAPITLDENAYIGAGSIVSCNVEKNELFVVRGNEKRIKNWRK